VGFKAGYVRTQDDIGLIFGCEQDSCQIAICGHDEERSVSASDLTPWVPRKGDCVTEARNEDSPIGFVVYAGEETSEVVWGGLFIRQQTWLNKNLEPAWIG
jgi:hypothetical protein